MTEQEIIAKVLDELGFTGKTYPEHNQDLVLTRNGAKVIAEYICEHDYDDPADGPNAAALKDCLWSFSDASWYGYNWFRSVTLRDLKKMGYVKQSRGKIYYRRGGPWIELEVA